MKISKENKKETKDKQTVKPKNQTTKKPDILIEIMKLKVSLNELKQNLDFMTSINLKCVEYKNCRENTNFIGFNPECIELIVKYVETKSGCDDKPFSEAILTDTKNQIQALEEHISVLEKNIKGGKNATKL